MKRLVLLVLAAIVAAGTFAATYGPWGESDAVKNPDKLGPTYFMSMPLVINGYPALQGDCVAVYRQDTAALCGLGKVLDDSGKLTLVCYAPQDVQLHFKVWVALSGTTDPKILDCNSECDLAAPSPGSFFTGHSLTADDEPEVETVVKMPIIHPADGTTFADSCVISLTCDTEGASIYYTTNGTTPKTSSKYLYTGPFTVYDTVQIKAVATKAGLDKSEYSTATITKQAMTLENALGVQDGMIVTTGGASDWIPVIDNTSKIGSLSAQSGLGNDDDESESWLQVSLEGAGELTFWAKTSCEHDDDNTFTWDRLMVFIDGDERIDMRMDGETDWVQKSIHFAESGSHTVRWVYLKDESDYDGEDCAWINGVAWVSTSKPEVMIDGDWAAVIIPDGVNPSDVTVEVPIEVKFLRTNGATIKIVKGAADITEYLDIPAAVDGVVNLGAAEVKEAIVKETLDPTKGAIIELSAEKPTLTTTETKPGLTYTLVEGATLESMTDGDSTVGNGQPWTPNISVKGVKSGFYTIKVTK